MNRAERSVVVNAPVDRLYDIIVDFGRYPEFLDVVKTSRVLSQDEGSARVAFSASLVGKSIPYTLQFTLARPHSVVWTLAESSFLKVNDGEWVLRPEGVTTHATYRLSIKVGTLIPAFLTNTVAVQSLPKVLAAFKARAEHGV